MAESTPERVYVLDLDNTVILCEDGTGSEEVKDGAWYQVFPELVPEYLGQVIAEVQQEIKGGKGDRQDIARRVCQYMGVPEDQVEQTVDERCRAFDDVVQRGILEVGVTPENRAALDILSKEATIYINTATPEEPVRQSLEALGLLAIAVGVLGRPGTKISNLRKIVELEQVDPGIITFVGDSESDFQAAQEVGCNFVGIWTQRNTAWHDSGVLPFQLIHSLAELNN